MRSLLQPRAAVATPAGMSRSASPRLALASLAAILALAGCGGGASSTGGKLSLNEESYDFGQVPLGELREHRFVITNSGTAVLDLQKEATVQTVEGC
ncbi:MAG: hypothetical protein QM765_38200 [Myxococcales bacterium]